jgi:thiol:disulfide interchange protein DsbD
MIGSLLLGPGGRARFAGPLLALACLWGAPALGQPANAVPPAESLVRVSAAPVEVRAGGTAEASLSITIRPGWHINANPPSPDYMVATTLAIPAAEGLSPGTPQYPAPKALKVGFEESPLLVYGDQVVIRLPLTAGPAAGNGPHRLAGKLRFQACNDQVCLPPASVPVELAVVVSGARAAAAVAPDTAGASAALATPTPAPPPAGPATGPPERSAATENPLMRAIEGGGWGAFLTLFLIGLALNLTPCVYPMLGVTVSIFGARRAAPPLQVLAYAVLYVLGMALMYSSLGLIAAFTGGLFGGVLQSPIVLGGIGLLLVALSLSMFGLYEFQLPPALLARLGGNNATGALGTFASGLMVGVFAAPCIGPPIVALLAVVGARGDPWFGFSSFFVLSMGLGAPYLVLGTFSNLIQTLPRSGEWMVWVKKVFGIILFAVGAFYALLAFAPAVAVWVVPVTLMLGGVYLGFFERSAERRPGFRWFKRLSGTAAAVVGVVLVAGVPARSVAFEPFQAEALESAMHGGATVMLDFTANWCAPCHELERFTFTDPRVRDSARSFRAFRIDLTHYDSPESERWRRRFEITGVPTVVFLTPDGSEVRVARVEGFAPPEAFLERMRLALAAGGQVAR